MELRTAILRLTMYPVAYRVIQPPFTLEFAKMSRKELRSYFNWFLAIIPERVNELASAVESSRGFENWQPDFTPKSLDALGEWFANQIETRPRTQEEIEELNALNPFPIKLSDRQLTNRTISLAMDIGMYLSQVFLRNHPSLEWDQRVRAKTFVDHGQPVLIPFHGGKVPFNPVGATLAFAYALRDKERTGERLREIYETKSRFIG